MGCRSLRNRMMGDKSRGVTGPILVLDSYLVNKVNNESVGALQLLS